jgi:hypothetical protein
VLGTAAVVGAAGAAAAGADVLAGALAGRPGEV